jgi:hypothetical protein
MLHGCLGCNAFLHYVRRCSHRPLADASPSSSPTSPPTPDPSSLCTADGCLPTGTIETLTHAFLECPEVQPVIGWMLATWTALGGPPVPRTAAFLLADDPTGWAGADDDDTYRMWTRLRVATLGSIWTVRCDRRQGGDSSFSHRACKLAVDSIVAAVGRDWQRTDHDLRNLDDGFMCRDWWRGVDTRISKARFVTQWTTPGIFCTLSGAAPAQAGARDARRLRLRLRWDRPVPLPP